MKRKSPSVHDEERFEKSRAQQVAKQVIRDFESMLEQRAEREALREKILAKYGFDIGTRQEAITQTGPYADQANLDRIALHNMEHGVGVIHIVNDEKEED